MGLEEDIKINLDLIFKKIILDSPNGIIIADEEGQIVFANSTAKKFFPNNTDFGVKIYELNENLRVLSPNTKNVQQIELNESIVHIHCMKISAGETDYIINIFMDLYESFVTQNELRFQKSTVNELRETLEGSYDGILVTDGEGNVLLVNQSYERITAIKKEDLIGHNMKDLINPIWMPNSVAFVVIEEKQPISKMQVTKEGKNIIVTGVPIFDKHRNIKKVVINARDITEIYQLREELLKSKEREETYLKNYSDFLEMIKKGEEQVIAVSSQMQEVFTLAEKVSNFQATILIVGESGVGKEEVAKCIHNSSLRKQNSFITINCGAIPANLLESELFGYEKGAFTGATNIGKVGLLEMAEGGTVFLDEIGETPLDFQVKLLRFLETKEVRKVGGIATKVIDVRIVAATNRNIEEMVENGTFREDLYYRLNVVQIKVPPLRKRTDDIGSLSLFFLAQYNQKYGQSKTLTYDVIKELEKFEWPGNVRQLKNVIENMVVISNNEYLQVNDLPWYTNPTAKANKKVVDTIYENEELSLNESVDMLEKLILERAKDKYKTSRAIADNLKVDQSTIVRKLKKYGL